ncbi:hypothetical protein BH24ACT5_BH24ACT5_05250 [soil metagenome]
MGETRQERRGSFALEPKSRVRSFDVVSSLMPLTSGTRVVAYRAAMVAAVVVPVVAAAAGLVSFAVVAAAVAIPAVFAVYLYDVNEWDDQPVPVVLGTIVLAGVLGAAAIRLVEALVLDPATRLTLDSSSGASRSILAFGVIAPVLAIVAGLLGPVGLASRSRFDDLLDGLTFGAVAGAAYAAGETLVMHRGVLDGDIVQPGDTTLWVSVVANAAITKPVVYAAALAIAGASFSGIGPGYEGFGPRFARGLGVAATGLLAYGLGVTLLAEVIGGSIGAVLGLVWALVVAGALILVLRTQLHHGVLEASLDAARGRPSRHEVRTGAHCGGCEMPLASLALFCSACGMSVRATGKLRQHANVGTRRAQPTRPGGASS